MTAFFASQDGIIAGRGDLLAYNLMGSTAIFGYSFVGTMIILYLINMVPFLQFRMSEHGEHHGDIAEMGEVAYDYDAVPKTAAEMKKIESQTSTIV